MPRKLPWMIQREPTATSSSKRRVTSPMPAQKRARASEVDGDSNHKVIQALPTIQRPQGRVGGTPPSSPPLERPMENFMHEGMDKDDQYRMVEDEFLATAQRFTVHLHAAEYKRQEKMARTRNAETISSISRPVTQKMPDDIKRKIEGISRSKMQQDTIQNLLGNKTGSKEEQEDSSDGEGLAYFNTTLRGLMDSPRRKAASLSKLQCGVATRAAAGFQRPASQHRQHMSQAQASPQGKIPLRPGRASGPKVESLAESSDSDDDLDAPVPTTRYTSLNKRPFISGSSHSSSPARITEPTSSGVRKTAIHKPPSREDQKSFTISSSTSQSVQASSKEGSRRVRRKLFQSQEQDAMMDIEAAYDKDLDLIPTFL